MVAAIRALLAALLLLPSTLLCQTISFSEVAKIRADDSADDDQFGLEVALDGDTLLVGAFANDALGSDSGSAYIFQRDVGGADVWGQVAKLTASDGTSGDNFGWSVALAGDTTVVGAFQNSAAYIFQRDVGGADAWGQMAKLTASDGSGGDWFGFSVALAGDTVVIGAMADGARTGSAYIFQPDSAGPDCWGEVAKLVAYDGRGGDEFGHDVAIAGDTVVVGASQETRGGPGAAYIFERDLGEPDAWGLVAKLTADDATNGDQFGRRVAIDGDTVATTAMWDDDLGSRSGSAYIFQRDVGGADAWGQVAKLTASDGASGDWFGESVTIAGDTVVVGAFLDSDLGYRSGSAYVFERHSGGPDAWGEVDKLTASDGSAGDRFGSHEIALTGNLLAIGAYLDGGGAVYVFERFYCLSFDALCGGIEIRFIGPDNTVFGTLQDWNCAGGTSPLVGGYTGPEGTPRRGWLASDPEASLDLYSFNLHVDNRTFDLFLHDTSFNLTQIYDDEPYTRTFGACDFGPEKAGLPSSMEWFGTIPVQARTESIEASPFGPDVTFPFCIDFDNSVDGIEVTAIQADKMIVATWENYDDGGSVAPMLGGFSQGPPRRAYIMSDIGVVAPGDIFVYTFEVDLGTYDLWNQDAAGNLTQIEDNQPFTITNGTCPF